MSTKIVVGPINKGLRTGVTAFNIDNDSFPILVNAYQWRGRVKRKRGTAFLGRLNRFIGTTDAGGNAVITINNFPGPTPIIEGISQFVIGTDIFIDQGGASPVALTTNGLGAGTLNRTTTVLTIVGSIPLTAIYYFPDLPVEGLEDLNLNASQFPGTLAFDTVYSYNILPTFPNFIYDVSFFKNPATGTYVGYTAKGTWTPVTWNGQDYQQFWTVNYQGALWATNGITVPFTKTNIGMQYKAITNVVIDAAGPPAIATITLANTGITPHNLVIGDFVFINEVVGITGINFQTGYVIAVAAATIQVEFPNATLGGAYVSGGIVQYLTNRVGLNSGSGKSGSQFDSIRWYDGDPTTDGLTPTPSTQKGWVNFTPPLISGPNDTFSIADTPPGQYYLVGARLMLPYKDRLLFFGPVIQTSAGNDTTENTSQIYLQDTVIYSQNGTPYYTVSYTNDPNPAVDTPISPTNVFHSILVPENQTATAPAWFEDTFGFGGFYTAGFAEPIISVSANEDVLIVGFTNRQIRMIYTGNDVVPFNMFIINSEFGDQSTFASITFDRGKLSVGDRGIVLSSQVASQRVDLQIPDQVFEFRLEDNGAQRITSQRDFINEWTYTTYCDNEQIWRFPNQTLQYNYRDESWAIFNESYTTYGQFRAVSGYTWATIGMRFPTWDDWDEPWNSGSSTLLQPQVIAGNQQGFIVYRDEGTGESNSLYIQNISGNIVTSPDHTLNDDDFIIISGAVGTNVSAVNGKIFQVNPIDDNTFTITPPPALSVTYLGKGLIKRIYTPLILSKQFPVAWDMGRKTRIGPQRYLFTTTTDGQITLQIYLSQNMSSSYNFGPVVPFVNSQNNSLVYSDILYTCPEGQNITGSASNINLNLLTAGQQEQTWHRMNTSLIGDTVQVGFTLSEEQLSTVDADGNPISQFAEIELHGMILDVTPSQLLV